MSDNQSKTETATYEDMLREVEQIVSQVGGSDLGLDQLVDKVERGYSLIASLQERLDATKERIEDLSEKFQEKT